MVSVKRTCANTRRPGAHGTPPVVALAERETPCGYMILSVAVSMISVLNGVPFRPRRDV
jgi:hypothetical protein